MQLVQKVKVTQGQRLPIYRCQTDTSFIVRWILNFVDQPTHENHENWYPTNKIDFTVIYIPKGYVYFTGKILT